MNQTFLSDSANNTKFTYTNILQNENVYIPRRRLPRNHLHITEKTSVCAIHRQKLVLFSAFITRQSIKIEQTHRHTNVFVKKKRICIVVCSFSLYNAVNSEVNKINHDFKQLQMQINSY